MSPVPRTLAVHLLDPPSYTRPYDDALARALAAQGVAVTLVTSRFAYGETPPAEGYRLAESFYRRTRGAPGSRRRALSGLAGHLPDMLAYRRLCARTPPQLLHVQWLTLPALDLRLLPARPTVLTLHDPGIAAGPGRFGIPAGRLARLDAIIVHSPEARTALLAAQPALDPARIHVVRHGPLGRPAGPGQLPPELGGSRRPGRPVVLFFGLLRAYKGIDTLLEAWARVRDAELWIVGRPLELSPALDPPPAGVTVVPRFVSPAEADAVFAAADLVVMPYLDLGRASFSGVLASALGHARPLVVSDLPGFAEVLAAGAAHAVPPGDPAALAAAIQALVEDPSARASLARTGAAFAARRLSWAEAASATRAVYAKVLAA
ncbi:MAG TPA: glycosyltransferase [Solirubrobacteraceae bacterium]|nr:glycosyltransferase [Solirubrobacteraceae bacterium]